MSPQSVEAPCSPSTPSPNTSSKPIPHHFLQFTFQRDDIQLVEILPTEQTTVETRHLDTLLKVQIDGQPSLVHYEFQTADSTPSMPRRMASYIGRLIGQYGLPVYAHVIYLRPDAGKNDPGSYIQEHPLYPIRIHYAVLRLAELPGETVRDGRLFGLLPVATLMQPPPGTNRDQWLTECMAMTRELPLDSPAKANMALGLAFYSSLTYDKQHLSILLSKERLMALVKESEFARDFLDMLREEFGDELRSEAEAEVRAEVEAEIRGQVIEQGIKQGREQGIRHSIQAVLELRFGASAAQAFAARLASIDDVQRLDHLHRVAVQASSLEEVSRLLDD